MIHVAFEESLAIFNVSRLGFGDLQSQYVAEESRGRDHSDGEGGGGRGRGSGSARGRGGGGGRGAGKRGVDDDLPPQRTRGQPKRPCAAEGDKAKVARGTQKSDRESYRRELMKHIGCAPQLKIDLANVLYAGECP